MGTVQQLIERKRQERFDRAVSAIHLAIEHSIERCYKNDEYIAEFSMEALLSDVRDNEDLQTHFVNIGRLIEDCF